MNHNIERNGMDNLPEREDSYLNPDSRFVDLEAQFNIMSSNVMYYKAMASVVKNPDRRDEYERTVWIIERGLKELRAKTGELK